MNFFEYVDIEFQKTSLNNSGGNYNLKKAGYAQALQMTLGWARTIWRWLMVPVVVYGFLSVKLGLTDAPISPLLKKQEEHGNKE